MPDTPPLPEFVPQDPQYRDRIMASFNRQQAMHSLGITCESVDPGRVIFKMPFKEAYTQQNGFIHAGILSTAMDSACGYAAFSLMPADASVLTVEYKVNFLAPATGDGFTIVGQVLKHGRTITVSQSEAFADINGQQKRVAQMTGTMMAVIGRKP